MDPQQGGQNQSLGNQNPPSSQSNKQNGSNNGIGNQTGGNFSNPPPNTSFDDIFSSAPSPKKDTFSQRDSLYDTMPPIFPEDDDFTSADSQSKSQKVFSPAESSVGYSPDEQKKAQNVESSQVETVTEGDIISSSQSEPTENSPFESEKSGFSDFQEKIGVLLHEANIGKRQIIFFCGGCAVLIMFFIFGGWTIKYFFFSGARPSENKAETQNEDVSKISQNEILKISDDGISASFLLGGEQGGILGFRDDSLIASRLIGLEQERFQTRFIQQIDHLKKFKNVLDTDLFVLLAPSREREKVLDDYIKNLESIRDESAVILDELTSLADVLRSQFDSNLGAKKDYEARFFAALRTLNGRETDFFLQKFTNIAQTQARLKAEYQSRQKIKSYFEILNHRADKRLKDILLNRDALIKGVKVVIVESSDLDLIIAPENLE